MNRRRLLRLAIKYILQLLDSFTAAERAQVFDYIFGEYCCLCGTADAQFTESGDCLQCLVNRSKCRPVKPKKE